MMDAHKCRTCNSCYPVVGLKPLGKCVFFPSGIRFIADVSEYSCPNHSELAKEEHELERTQNRRKHSG